MNDADNGKQAAALAALRYLEDGMVIGVGTGSTVNHFIDALAPWRDRLKGAVSSSESSTTRLRSIGNEFIDVPSDRRVVVYGFYAFVTHLLEHGLIRA